MYPPYRCVCIHLVVEVVVVRRRMVGDGPLLCPDMYWFAYAADPPAERQRRGLWAQQVDELASPEQELDGAAGAQKESPCSPLGMSVRAARATPPSPRPWSSPH